MKKKILKDLPSSSDKEFWEGANIRQVRLEKAQMSKHTKLVMRGGYVVCLSCPFEHTIPGCVLNEKGELYKLDKEKRI